MIDLKAEDQGYSLPPEMGNIITATVVQTSQGDVILCHDNAFIYAAKVVKGGGNVTFQKFSLPLVASLVAIIKNYFMATFDSKKLIIFEVAYNQQSKIMMKFIYNKDRPVSSYFLREVTDNMAELQIYFPQNQISIFQFTVNGKIGTMNYSIAQQNKIRLCERQQLYGSKTMLCLNRKTLYYFTNFSNKFVSAFSLGKFQNEIATQYQAFPIAYVSRLEEFYVLLSNYLVVNVMNLTQNHRVSCEQNQGKLIQQLLDPKEIDRYRQKGENRLKITSYFDMVLVEDVQKSITFIFQLKQKGSSLIGIQYGKINWFWTCSRKLVGLSMNRDRFKIIEEIKINERDEVENPFYSPLNPNLRKDYKLNDNSRANEGKEEKINLKTIIKEEPKNSDKESPEKAFPPTNNSNEEKVEYTSNQFPPQKTGQIELKVAQKFKPKKIIQKGKVSVSKSVHKSKEIEPFSKDGQINEELPPSKQTNEEVPKQQDENQSELAEKISKECQQIANSLFQKQSEEVKPVQITSNQQKEQQEEIDEASCEEVEVKKQGDTYPKQESDLSESLIVPDKKEDENKEVDANDASKVDQQSKEESKEEGSLPKSLALLIGRSTLGGEYSHPLNLFNTSINRNNIFNSLQNNQNKPIQQTQQLRRYHSEEEYYNPLTSTSPCQSPKKEIEKKEEDEVNEVNESERNLIEKVKGLFQETTTRLLRVVDELANLKSQEPYIKDKIMQEMKKNIKENLEKFLVGDLTSRIQRYFYEIFRQTDQVQQQSIKFYKEANNHRASNIQVNLNNQEKIIKEVRDIESNLKFCITHLKESNRATFQGFLREWTQQSQQTKKVIEHLNVTRVKIEIQQEARAKRYEETKINLDSIKALLSERINLEAEKKQRKIERQKLKQLQKEEKLKKEKKKKSEKKTTGKKSSAN